MYVCAYKHAYIYIVLVVFQNEFIIFIKMMYICY